MLFGPLSDYMQCCVRDKSWVHHVEAFFQSVMAYGNGDEVAGKIVDKDPTTPGRATEVGSDTDSYSESAASTSSCPPSPLRGAVCSPQDVLEAQALLEAQSALEAEAAALAAAMAAEAIAEALRPDETELAAMAAAMASEAVATALQPDEAEMAALAAAMAAEAIAEALQPNAP